jgi:transposase
MLRTPVESPPIPADTSRVATAIFPEGHRLMRIRDALGSLFQTTDFAHLFPALGQPALDPARLALVAVLPCLEGLSDRQAAEHVRRCIDWQYA